MAEQEQTMASYNSDELSLSDILGVFRSSWVLILLTTLVFTTASIIYIAMSDRWYRATTLLSIADESMDSAQIGSAYSTLAALGGISLGGGKGTEAKAVLESQEFASEFIKQNTLLPLFFPGKWDASRRSWKSEDFPDIQDGVEYFHEEVLRVSQNRETSLVTVSVEWRRPDQAAEWANALVRAVNEKLRQESIERSAANIEYLKEQLGENTLLPLQQSISRLLETEFQKSMLAQGAEEYAFRVLDPARPPKEHVRPRTPLIIVISIGFGVLIGFFLALIRRGRGEGNRVSAAK